MDEEIRRSFDSVTEAMFEQCRTNAPNYGITVDRFRTLLGRTVEKYFKTPSPEPPQSAELEEFLGHIQSDDLFIAIACADGNENAWWEFDQSHRSYMQRVARHLASSDIDAEEVVDFVYGELYGTRVVDGERVSKFSTYSGRGSLRGWLRTVIWHSVVDLHRASHDEISLDEMTEAVGEGAAHSNFAVTQENAEEAMIDHLTLQRYRDATLAAMAEAFGGLDAHEKLLLNYYHVDNLKLREIARLAENETSPLRAWFQRRSTTRDVDPGSRIHESTVMRWLEKSYARVLKLFRDELISANGFNDEEVDICVDLASQDLSVGSVYRNLAA